MSIGIDIGSDFCACVQVDERGKVNAFTLPRRMIGEGPSRSRAYCPTYFKRLKSLVIASAKTVITVEDVFVGRWFKSAEALLATKHELEFWFGMYEASDRLRWVKASTWQSAQLGFTRPRDKLTVESIKRARAYLKKTKHPDVLVDRITKSAHYSDALHIALFGQTNNEW